MPDSETQPHSNAVLLFDGVCNLCNGAVNFIIDRDPEAYFTFAALQSEAGQALLRRHGLEANYLDSLVLIENGYVYRHSEAALRVARRLGLPWSLAYPIVALPRAVRDALYNWVAAHRYRWFGRRETCLIPTPELRARFL